MGHTARSAQVQEARPVVDSRAPLTLSHLRLKLGKLKVSFSPAPLTVTANTAQKISA